MDAHEISERSKAHPALSALAMDACTYRFGIFVERDHAPSVELMVPLLSVHSMTCHILC